MKGWKMIAATTAALIGTAAIPARAEVDMSVSLGLMSDYTHRGFHRSSSTLNGEIKLTAGGFHAGAWAANLDSGDGGEINLFGGLAWDIWDGLESRLGFRAYRFTDDDNGVMEAMCVGGGVDQDYDEITLGLGYEWSGLVFALDYSVGEHKNGHSCRAEDNDYDYGQARVEYMGAYAQIGAHGLREDDTSRGAPEGELVEYGYSMKIDGLDVTFFGVSSNSGIDDGTRLGMRVDYGFEL